jgi:hypothetical protein
MRIKLSSLGARILCAVALVLTIGAAAQAQPPIEPRPRIEQTSNDLPFYARIERGLIHTDGEWAAIAFYRPPDCVRSDFNLLNFFDPPAAFGCNADEPYLEGFGVFMNSFFEAPIQSQMQTVPGRTMPVWFVSWSDMEAAIADDSLTIGELAAMPSRLTGQAVYTNETVHPFQASQQTKTTYVTFGYLDANTYGWTTFSYEATETHNILRNVRIVFN